VSHAAGAPGIRITSKTRSPRDHAARVRSLAAAGPHGSRLGSHRSPTEHVTTMGRWCKAERRNPATRPTCPCRGALTCPPRPPWLEQTLSRLPPAACRSVPRRANPRAPRSLAPASHRARIRTNRSPPTGHRPTPQTLLARTGSRNCVHVGRHARSRAVPGSNRAVTRRRSLPCRLPQSASLALPPPNLFLRAPPVRRR